MKTALVWLSFMMIFVMAAASDVFADRAFGADSQGQDSIAVLGGKNRGASSKTSGFKPQPYSHNQDIAFVSLMGSRPRGDFSGYRKAVLYNAKGAVIQEIDISRSDSIYSLDRMIQENRTKGPLIIRMRK
ncbi:MAG: hypothetical protein FWE57_09090 [Chitinispirillia bacterium]|nr:hypothetical protein [Chitinispirillia bacterium]